MIYFFENTANKLIKIGTSANVTLRHYQIQETVGSPVRVLGVMEGDEKIERDLHNQFAVDRILGEWFRLSDPLSAFITQNCKPYESEKHGGPDGYQKRAGSYEPGPGRPVKIPGLIRTTIYLTQEQRDFLAQVAAENHVGMSDVIRALIDRARPQSPRLSQERIRLTAGDDEGEDLGY